MERQTKPKSRRVAITETIKQDKMVSFKSSLLSKVDNFRSGKFEKHDTQWRKLTRDPNVLSIDFSDKIEFDGTPRNQHKARSPDLHVFPMV